MDIVKKNILIPQTRKVIFSSSTSTQTLKLELPYSVNSYRTFLTQHKTPISWKTVFYKHMHKHVHSQSWEEKGGPVSLESKPSFYSIRKCGLVLCNDLQLKVEKSV